MTLPKSFRNGSAPDGGNILALRLSTERAPGWHTPAAAHSKPRRAAQSEDGWSQLSSKLYVLMESRVSPPGMTGETPVPPPYESYAVTALSDPG